MRALAGPAEEQREAPVSMAAGRWGWGLPGLPLVLLGLVLVPVLVLLGVTRRLRRRFAAAPRGSAAGEAAVARALVLTAHPDDEAMFFAPTLLALGRAGGRPAVLCCSAGEGTGGRGGDSRLPPLHLPPLGVGPAVRSARGCKGCDVSVVPPRDVIAVLTLPASLGKNCAAKALPCLSSRGLGTVLGCGTSSYPATPWCDHAYVAAAKMQLPAGF